MDGTTHMTTEELVTVDQAIAAIGDKFQVHTVSKEKRGHLKVETMTRGLFLTLIKMPTCRLSHAEMRFVDMGYPLRVETTQRVFYVFCNKPLEKE
jgi:hypothetical protein